MRNEIAPSFAVDEKVWSSYPYWRAFEIEHLVVDIDPDKIEGNFEFDYSGADQQQMKRVRRILDRWRSEGIADKGMRPQQAIEILQEHGFSFPDRLVVEVRKKSGRARFPNEYSDEPIAEDDGDETVSSLKNERQTLRQIMLAMAIEKFDFRPSQNRNKATSQITQLTETMGLKVHRDTVHRHLDRAVNSLTEDQDLSVASYVRSKQKS